MDRDDLACVRCTRIQWRLVQVNLPCPPEKYLSSATKLQQDPRVTRDALSCMMWLLALSSCLCTNPCKEDLFVCQRLLKLDMQYLRMLIVADYLRTAPIWEWDARCLVQGEESKVRRESRGWGQRSGVRGPQSGVRDHGSKIRVRARVRVRVRVTGTGTGTGTVDGNVKITVTVKVEV